MGIKQYLRVDMSNGDVAKVVEDAFDNRGGYIEVETLRRAMRDMLGKDPTEIVRFDEKKLGPLTHCGSDNGIVYYTINDEMINAIDYYSRKR